MKPCPIGSEGSCCKNCSMGPCRVPAPKKKSETAAEKAKRRGVCGATAETIAARNFIRMIAGGAAAHSDHGRGVAETFLAAARGQAPGYEIKDEQKLFQLAMDFGVEIGDRSVRDVAIEVGEKALAEFGRQEGEIVFLKRAPLKRQELWKKLGVAPRGVDREIVEIMHRTHIGVDADYRNLIRQGLRAALGDGWGGSMIATELSDVIFDSPRIQQSAANLGVLRADMVNLVVHGHEPTLSDIIAVASRREELLEKARAKGAKGINLAGICCTANEILMRHGIPLAGSFMQQELAVLTGAVDLMVVDVQCLMPALAQTAKHFHTRLLTTSPKARIPGFEHIEFHEDKAVEIATQIIEAAIDNFPNRNGHRQMVPQSNEGIVAGFTAESVFRFLGGTYRATYRPLNDAIIAGRLRGAAGVIGCSNPNVDYEEGHIKMVKELIGNDVLVVTTGCNAISCAKHGLLKPESAFRFAGKGLQEICRAVGIPPVLHVGSCVDNSRILRILTNVVAEGGLGDDLSDLPVAGAAPEWMSEKAVSIGFYFVASGVYTMIGHPLPMMGSRNLHKYLTEEIEQEVGGKWAFELDPVEAAHKMLRHIDEKRKTLKLRPIMYEQAFAPQG
jgi:carbon-monoxide dehydrogenase catalytic subunit